MFEQGLYEQKIYVFVKTRNPGFYKKKSQRQ